MHTDLYRDAQRLALEAGILAVRLGEWATREGHALFVSAHKRLEETARAAEQTEAKEHAHGLGAEVPAVPVEKSVTEDYLVCLEDGKRFRTLTRHLRKAHGLSRQAYCEKWGLPDDYPMSAPGYAAKRAAVMAQVRAAKRRVAQARKAGAAEATPGPDTKEAA